MRGIHVCGSKCCVNDEDAKFMVRMGPDVNTVEFVTGARSHQCAARWELSRIVTPYHVRAVDCGPDIHVRCKQVCDWVDTAHSVGESKLVLRGDCPSARTSDRSTHDSV